MYILMRQIVTRNNSYKHYKSSSVEGIMQIFHQNLNLFKTLYLVHHAC